MTAPVKIRTDDPMNGDGYVQKICWSVTSLAVLYSGGNWTCSKQQAEWLNKAFNELQEFINDVSDE